MQRGKRQGGRHKASAGIPLKNMRTSLLCLILKCSVREGVVGFNPFTESWRQQL